MTERLSALEGGPVVLPAIKEQILSDLDRLSPAQQQRAAELIRGLTSSPARGVPGRQLLRFSGWLDDGSAREMMGAIEEGCERGPTVTSRVAARAPRE